MNLERAVCTYVPNASPSERTEIYRSVALHGQSRHYFVLLDANADPIARPFLACARVFYVLTRRARGPCEGVSGHRCQEGVRRRCERHHRDKCCANHGAVRVVVVVLLLNVGKEPQPAGEGQKGKETGTNRKKTFQIPRPCRGGVKKALADTHGVCGANDEVRAPPCPWLRG